MNSGMRYVIDLNCLKWLSGSGDADAVDGSDDEGEEDEMDAVGESDDVEIGDDVDVLSDDDDVSEEAAIVEAFSVDVAGV